MLIPYSANDSPAGARFSGLANWESVWALCEGYYKVVWEIEWILAAGPAPAGELVLQGNNDVGTPGLTPATAMTFTIPAPAGTPGTYAAWPTVAAATGNATIVVINPIRFMRVGYVFAGGGAAGQFKVTRSMTPP